MREPIKLTLYDRKTNEPVKTVEQRIITMDMLKRAARLSELMEDDDTPESTKKQSLLRRLCWWIPKPTKVDEQIDMLLQFVSDFYGGRVAPEELSRGADVPELMTVLRSIMGTAGKIIQENPTKPSPQRQTRKRH
jgi:hypothetical protein